MMLFSPYQDEQLDLIYNLVFCDDISIYKENFHGELPENWKTLFSESALDDELLIIAQNPSIESRIRILAYNALLARGVKDKSKEILGVIIEVGLEAGLDTLAAFQDHRARYINHSGKIIFWEDEDENVDRQIDALFSAAGEILSEIGPWDKPRLEPPTDGNVRLTFIVSDGLYFGQGVMQVMQNDPLGGKVLTRGVELLQVLLSKVA